MPNRILKGSICASEEVDQLTWFEEVFFYRLIVTCDDYGRYDGRPAMLKSNLFPLKSVTEKQVVEALNKLSTVGIVCLYEVDGKPFLQLATWEKHQNIRAQKSKYPQPEHNEMQGKIVACTSNPTTTNDGKGKSLHTDENNCMQLYANAPVIQSESESISESNPNQNYATGDGRASSALVEAAVFNLPQNDGDLYPVTQKDIDFWQELYPATQVETELRKMIGWLDSNPTKRKTKNGMKKFITGWLGKNQDNPSYTTTSKTAQPAQEKGFMAHAKQLYHNYSEEQE
ncbi:MAG: hypothetical protein R3Y63_08775 [Eubacteriales bacterium]